MFLWEHATELKELKRLFKIMEESFFKERKEKFELLDKLEELEADANALQILLDDVAEENKKNLARAQNAENLASRYQIYLSTELLIYLRDEKLIRPARVIELFALNVEKDETVFGGYSKNDVKAYEGGKDNELCDNENTENQEL